MKQLLLILLLAWAAGAAAQSPQANASPQVLPLAAVPAHDPVMIRADSTWYTFATGMGISVWSSNDMKQWRREPPVFAEPPQWAVSAVRGFKGHIWAPDISYYNGRYYLYYAVSAFGKNTSCIGLATNTTLNPRDPACKWEDHGKVIESIPGRDMWNAIDPNLAVDDEGTPWLAFGSFWNGIKLVRLTPDRDKLAQPEQWYTIAARPRDPATPDSAAGEAAIEAPFIFKKDRYFYLFVSFDYCCRGEKSNYRIMVGRSETIQGPYLDKTGVPMRQGGGTVVLEGGKDWYGVGHNAVVRGDSKDWIVFHGYDAHDKGHPRLRIEQLDFIDGWPVVQKEK